MPQKEHFSNCSIGVYRGNRLLDSSRIANVSEQYGAALTRRQ